MRSGVRWAELGLALGVLALAVVLAWQTTEIQVNPAYSRIGPRIFPIAVCIAMAAVALLLGIQAAGWAGEPPQRDQTPTDYRALGLVGAGFVAQILLLRPIGFVISATILFVFTAAAFGSRRMLRDVAAGLAVAAVVYIGFTRGLTIELPAGILAGAL